MWAYKGQAGNLMSNPTLLRAALQIHSVEARHAAHIRMMRRRAGVADIKPWITLNTANGAPAAVYAGEENVTQAGVNVASNSSLTNALASESFDEPLTMAAVTNDSTGIADPFIV